MYFSQEVQELVDKVIQKVDEDLLRRRKDREKVINSPDKKLLVVDRVMSRKLATVRGMQGYLDSKKKIREEFDKREVEDPFSHCAKTVGDLHKSELKPLFRT